MKRKLISSGSEFETRIGYSRAVVDGDYVFVSGTTGYDYSTMSISSDPVEQAEQCFRNIEQALVVAFRTIMNDFIKELRLILVPLVHDLVWGSAV